MQLSPRCRIGRLSQEAPDGPESLLDIVLRADEERLRLLAEAETAHDPHRIADIQTRLADIGAHSAPARAAEILAGLGFSADDQERPCSEFSGGWRMRVALAATLFAATRPAAARRADQLPRSRKHAVAAEADRRLSPHRRRDQPRPRPARQCGRLDAAPRGRNAHALSRRLQRRSSASGASARRSTSSSRASRRSNASA